MPLDKSALIGAQSGGGAVPTRVRRVRKPIVDRSPFGRPSVYDRRWPIVDRTYPMAT
jgi:hypothetical protein